MCPWNPGRCVPGIPVSGFSVRRGRFYRTLATFEPQIAANFRLERRYRPWKIGRCVPGRSVLVRRSKTQFPCEVSLPKPPSNLGTSVPQIPVAAVVRSQAHGPPGSVPGGPCDQIGGSPLIWAMTSSRTIFRQATSWRRVQCPRYWGSAARNRSSRGVGRIIGSIAPGRTDRPRSPAGASIRRSSGAGPSSFHSRVPPRLLLKYPLRNKVNGPGRDPMCSSQRGRC
jgi:hypothetical protein